MLLEERCSPRQKSRVGRLKAKVEPLLTFGNNGDALLPLQSFLRKGVSLGNVGRNYNLTDLKTPWYVGPAASNAPDLGPACSQEVGIFLPNNQHQHRTSHAPKDVLPLRICAKYCAPCQPLLRAFPGWIRSPPPTPALNYGTVQTSYHPGP